MQGQNITDKQANNSFANYSKQINQITQNLNTYVLSPLQQLGIAGFVFDKIISSNVRTATHYTNNYVEQGAFITDHSITEPKKITITGYVGEKVYSQQESRNTINKILQKLPIIVSAVPKLTTGMQQLKNALDKDNKTEIDNVVNSTVDFWNLVKGVIPPSSKSGQAYVYFEALRQTNARLGLTEPDGSYHYNMVITSIEKVTREYTLDIVDFVIELQEWRLASSLFSPFDKSKYPTQVANQKQDVVSTKGSGQKPTKKETNTLESVLNVIKKTTTGK